MFSFNHFKTLTSFPPPPQDLKYLLFSIHLHNHLRWYRLSVLINVLASLLSRKGRDGIPSSIGSKPHLWSWVVPHTQARKPVSFSLCVYILCAGSEPARQNGRTAPYWWSPFSFQVPHTKQKQKQKQKIFLQNKECTYPSKGTQAHLAFGCESVAQVKWVQDSFEGGGEGERYEDVHFPFHFYLVWRVLVLSSSRSAARFVTLSLGPLTIILTRATIVKVCFLYHLILSESFEGG